MDTSVQFAAAAGVAVAAWLLALGFTASRAALVASLPLGVAVVSAVPPISAIAAPIMILLALKRLPPDVRARNGGFFKRGAEGGLSPLAVLAAWLTVAVIVGGAWAYATQVEELMGEPVQMVLAVGLVIGGVVGGFVMSLLARRVAFLEALWVTALTALLPVLFSSAASTVFTYGTAAAYYAVILLSALLLLGLSLILGGSFGFLFCGDGDLGARRRCRQHGDGRRDERDERLFV